MGEWPVRRAYFRRLFWLRVGVIVNRLIPSSVAEFAGPSVNDRIDDQTFTLSDELSKLAMQLGYGGKRFKSSRLGIA